MHVSFIANLKTSEYVQVPCDKCSKIFIRRVSDLKRRFKHKETAFITCSTECAKSKRGKYLPCLQCGKEVYRPPNQFSKPVFCSSSCFATNRNPSRTKQERKCLLCGNTFMGLSNRKYCSLRCQGAHRKALKVGRAITYLDIKDNPELINEFLPRVRKKNIKVVLFEERGHKCQVCGISEWLGKPVLLILDHINGLSNDDRRENLQLVCSNCDATLPTYKNRNKGKGRASRRLRYKLGQSY